MTSRVLMGPVIFIFKKTFKIYILIRLYWKLLRISRGSDFNPDLQGVHQYSLVLPGGANFPDTLPFIRHWGYIWGNLYDELSLIVRTSPKCFFFEINIIHVLRVRFKIIEYKSMKYHRAANLFWSGTLLIIHFCDTVCMYVCTYVLIVSSLWTYINLDCLQFY